VTNTNWALPKFQTTDFTNSWLNSAKKKARFANHFARFVAAGFSGDLFYGWFYNYLRRAFRYDSSYDRKWFFRYYFTSTQMKRYFLWLTSDPQNSSGGRYAEANRVIITWLKESSYLDYWIRLGNEEIKESEIKALTQLKAKYPEV